jgi:hypothetical protein
VLPLRAVLILLGASLALFGCSSTPAPDLNYKPPPDVKASSLRLKERMTEEEVQHAIDAAPATVQLTTCGQDVGKPWQCKLWTYGGMFTHLIIVFQKSSDNQWRVISWRVVGP